MRIPRCPDPVSSCRAPSLAVVLLFSLVGSATAQQPQPRVSPSQTPVMAKPAAPIVWAAISESYPLAQPQAGYAIPLFQVNPPAPFGYMIWTPEGGWHWRVKTSWTQIEFPAEARGVRSSSQVMASTTVCGPYGKCSTFPIAWKQSYYVAYPAGVIAPTQTRVATQSAATVSWRSLSTLATDARAAPVAPPSGTPVRESDPTPPYAGSWATLYGSQKVELNGGARVLMLEGNGLVLRTSAGALIAEFPTNAHVVRLPDSRVEVWTYVGSKASGPS